MKHLFTLSFLLFAAASFGQAFDVTFTVNMANEDTSAEGVFLAGGGMFGLPGDNPMSDADMDDVWEITMEIDPSSPDYEPHYTFLNGNCGDWSCKENLGGLPCGDPGNFNDRILPDITGDMTIMHCFAQCTTDGTCPDVGGPINVTFSVNMEEQTVAGGVYITGAFDSWCGNCNEMLDPDMDDVYEITMEMNPGSHEYKFTNGGWDGDDETFNATDFTECTLTTGEFTNRLVMVAGADPMVLDVVCWESCDDCDGTGGGEDADVTFSVDMNEQTVQGPIYVTGNTVDNWCGTCVEMLDDDSDGIYEVTLPLGEGPHEYKYNNGGWDFTETLDSIADAACTLTTDGFTNRYFELVGTDDVVLDTDCFEACGACIVDGTADLSVARFSMYPSIASDRVQFNFPQGNGSSRVLSIYNTATQLVEKRTLGSEVATLDLDVTAFGAGLYIVTVECAGASEVQKLVITK